jgi:hypothetical protein
MTMAFSAGEYRKLYNSTNDEKYLTRATMIENWVSQDGDFTLSSTQAEIADKISSAALIPIVHQMGRIAFADSNDPTHAELLKSANIDIEKTPELNAKIQSMLAPIVFAAKDKMPTLPTAEDKKRFGTLHEQGVVEWTYEKNIDNLRYHYHFSLNYIPSRKGNTLQQLRMNFGNGNVNNQIGDFKMQFFFTNDSISKIDLTNSTRDRLNNDNCLRDLLSKSQLDVSTSDPHWHTDVLGGRYVTKNRLHGDSTYAFIHQSIHLEPSAISMNSEGYDRSPIIARTYDPTLDKFRLAFVAGGVTKADGPHMEKAKVIQTIKAIADLVPIRDAYSQ